MSRTHTPRSRHHPKMAPLHKDTKVNIVIRGEINRVGGQFARICDSTSETKRMHTQQRNALLSILKHFAQPAMKHFSVSAILFDVMISSQYKADFDKLVAHFRKVLAVKIFVHVRHATTGTQNSNMQKAYTRLSQEEHQKMENTFILRGDCHFEKKFPFQDLVVPDHFYVISRTINFKKTRPYVIDTFWYIPLLHSKAFLAALDKNEKAITLDPKVGLHLLYQRLRECRVPEESLDYLKPFSLCRPLLNSVCYIIGRPLPQNLVPEKEYISQSNKSAGLKRHSVGRTEKRHCHTRDRRIQHVRRTRRQSCYSRPKGIVSWRVGKRKVSTIGGRVGCCDLV